MPTSEGKTDPATLKTHVDNINSDLDEFAKAMAQVDPSGQQIAKAMYVKDFESAFEKKYPLLCINSKMSERELILAQTRFPSEIKRDALFVGNAINVIK